MIEIVIDGYRKVKENFENTFVISAPNIHCITLFGHACRRIYKLIGMSSLVEGNVVFTLVDECGNKFCKRNCNMLKELLENLRYVSKLTIGTWCLQVLLQLYVTFLHTTCTIFFFLLKQWAYCISFVSIYYIDFVELPKKK